MAEPARSASAKLPGALGVLLLLVDPWLVGRERELAERLAACGAIDWPAVIAHASRHRITPFLANRIAQLADGPIEQAALPQASIRDLQQEQLRARAAEMAMLGEIRRLDRMFAARHVDVLLLKGLALSARCYEALGQRINHDIDLVLDPADLDVADGTMRAAGYRRIEPAEEASPAECLASTRRSKDWVYAPRSGRGHLVEIHHRLFDNETLCRPDVMARAQRIDLFGQCVVRTLGPDDELPYLALHGALHAWSRLKWLIDFGLLLRQRTPDEIGELLKSERGRPAAAALHQGIALCERLFKAADIRPRCARPWQTGLLSHVALASIARHGTRELEETRFGTTFKNLSHYLLWPRLGYVLAELRFDISDETRDDPQASQSILPFWIRRPAAWLSRHL